MKYPARLLCISGHDPSGGAGIQADIEACGAMGAHPLSVLSSLTVQDSAEVYAVQMFLTNLSTASVCMPGIPLDTRSLAPKAQVNGRLSHSAASNGCDAVLA